MNLVAEWLGNACFLLRSDDGRCIIIDPWLEGNPGCPYDVASAPTVDYVLVTHGHPGHFGRSMDSVRLAVRTNASYVAAAELCTYVADAGGVSTIALNPGSAVALWDDCFVLSYVAPHPPSNPGIYLGEAPGEPNCGFLINWGGYRIVHVGDAIADPVFKMISGGGGIDLACLPSWTPNAHEDEEATLDHLVEMCQALNPRRVFPHCRYDASLKTSDLLQRRLSRADMATTVEWAAPGQSIALGEGGPTG